MKSSSKEIIIEHSASNLYNIVLDIEKYPEFIPWCKEIIIISKSKNRILADMLVSYKIFLPQTFRSDVTFNAKKLFIITNYIKGPLKNLNTKWSFIQLEKKITKVKFEINFEFERTIHQKLAEIFFNLIEEKMIKSFKKRAEDILN